MNDGKSHLTAIHNRAIDNVYAVEQLTPDEALRRLRNARMWRYQADLFNRNRARVLEVELRLETHLRRLGIEP